MKTLKISMIATLVTILLIVLCGSALAEVGDRGEFYPRLTVVTSYEQTEEPKIWLINCTDKDGEVWSFYGEKEDAHIGNIFNLLMWNLGGPEKEDEVVEVYYEGRLDHAGLIAWLMGEWR